MTQPSTNPPHPIPSTHPPTTQKTAAYVMTHLKEFTGDNATALNSTSAALLKAAARDAGCAIRATAAACGAGPDKNRCEWFDAEVRAGAEGGGGRGVSTCGV